SLRRSPARVDLTAFPTRRSSDLSLQGVTLVRLMFNLGADIGIAQQDVQAKVARIRRQLPANIDEPVIQHFDPNESPIMAIAVERSEEHTSELQSRGQLVFRLLRE